MREAAEEEVGHFAARVSFSGAGFSRCNKRHRQPTGENFIAENWVSIRAN